MIPKTGVNFEVRVMTLGDVGIVLDTATNVEDITAYFGVLDREMSNGNSILVS